MSDNEHSTDQFDDEPVSIFRDGKFILVYPDGTEVEEKVKSKKERALEVIDRARKKED